MIGNIGLFRGYKLWKGQQSLLDFSQIVSTPLITGSEVGWLLPEKQFFQDQFVLKTDIFRNWAHGMSILNSAPIDALWQILLSNKRIIDNFRPFKHNPFPFRLNASLIIKIH